MRTLILAGVAMVGLMALATPSQAVVISYQVLDGNNQIGSGSSSNGFLAISGSDANFNISGNAAGAPMLASPNFSTNNFEMSAGGAAGRITIRITATDLTSYSGAIRNTFTLNSLTAASTFQSGTISNYFDASNAAFGVGTQLGTVTFTGIDSFSSENSTNVAMTTPFSETTIYTLNFGAGSSSSLSSSSQLIATTTAVPEPASLALLGVGLVSAGVIRRRRSSTEG